VGYLTGPSDFGEIVPIVSKWTEKPKKFARAGDILLTVKGSGVGKTNLLDIEEVAISRQIMAVRAKKIEPRFLDIVLQSLHQYFASLANGAAIPGISRTDVTDYQIPLPPLEEQRQIVAVLDEAFEGLSRARAHAEANLQNARELFESIKADALDYNGPNRETVVLSDVADVTSGLVDPRKAAYAELPHVGAGNMITGSDELVGVITAREEKLISGKYLFDQSMVLYSKIRPYLRKAARPNFGGLCSADVYPVAPKKGVLDRDFLFHLLLGHDFTAYAISGSDRAGMPKVNRNHMFAYTFDLPPLEEQQKIGTVIDEAHIACSELIELAKTKLQSVDALRQSLLQKAFAGELLKDQDV
jgi:type I restriction enzyme S subunit